MMPDVPEEQIEDDSPLRILRTRLENELESWAGQPRAEGDVPTYLEQILTFGQSIVLSESDSGGIDLSNLMSGGGLVNYDEDNLQSVDLPSPNSQRPSIAERLVAVLKEQNSLSPVPSIGLIVHDDSVYLSAVRTSADGNSGQATLVAGIPSPGDSFADFRQVDLNEVLNSRGGEPYGEEALEVSAHLMKDLFMNLNAWALSDDRGEDDSPPELFMYDLGVMWSNNATPGTSLESPSLPERVQELKMALNEVAPAPGAISFIHDGEFYILSGQWLEPGDLVIHLSRVPVGPPGELLGLPETVDLA